jgi:hypothetical protein
LSTLCGSGSFSVEAIVFADAWFTARLPFKKSKVLNVMALTDQRCEEG